jgi:hypothetical protein
MNVNGWRLERKNQGSASNSKFETLGYAIYICQGSMLFRLQT